MDNSIESTRLPQIFPSEAQPFVDGLKERRLLLKKCCNCGHVWLMHSTVCPVCLASDYTWIEASGEATVYSFVIFQRTFHPEAAPRPPYVVAQVCLKEGPLILSNIENCQMNMIYCEQKLLLSWEDVGNDMKLPVFSPVVR